MWPSEITCQIAMVSKKFPVQSGRGIPAKHAEGICILVAEQHNSVCSTSWLGNQSRCRALGKDRLALSLSRAGTVCHPWADWRLASLSLQREGLGTAWRGDGWISEWIKAGKTPGSCRAHLLSVGEWEGSIRSPISVVTLRKDNVTQMLRINNSEENKRHKTRAPWAAAKISAEAAPVHPHSDKVCIWTLYPDVNP